MAASQSLGRLLRRHRHDADLTLEKLSEASGVSVRAISNLELGHSLGPQSATIDLIASSLGLGAPEREELLSAARVGRRGASQPAPAVLAMPRGVNDFVGRVSEVRFLVGLVGLVEVGRSGPAPVVVVSGIPGVGKTSFAVHAAGQLAGAFPDGRLFLDLRGLDELPPEPGMLLGRLISALAPDHQAIPHDLGERAGLYRTLLMRRRVLIVLDNAADESQVRTLLPGDGPSLMLITSRRRLSGLETAHRLSLVPLTRTFAVQMLSNLVGDHRAADNSSLDRLAELSGNLPLALRLIGNRLGSHPDTSSARFAQRLGVEEHRLETLTAGDMRISAVFTSSYAQLSVDAQQLFRRLALIPAQDTGPAMAAVLADLPLPRAEFALDELVEFGLLQTRFTDRYRLHDLIRLFARARLDSVESAADVVGTRARVVDWLLSTATVAGRWFEPDLTALPADGEHHLGRPREEDPDDRVPMQTPALARQWLVTEADNWLAALRTAARERRSHAVVAVTQALHWFSETWPDWGHWTEVFRLGSVAAERLGDARTIATQLNYLSWSLNVCDGDIPAAAVAAQRAYAAAESVGDVRQLGWARFYLVAAQIAGGDQAGGLAAALEASRLAQQAGDRDSRSQAQAMVARGLENLGRIDEALESHRQQVADVTDPATAPSLPVAAASELFARASMGRLHNDRGSWEAAVQVLRPTVALVDTVAIPRMQAIALAGLGEALCGTGCCGEGLERLLAALALYERLNNTSETARVQALLRHCTVG